ncbi:MAG: Rieske 2Fe-2S domain-containing protein [Acidimicrobiales bacterium]
MEVMLTGHAGLWITTGETTVLCDPWFNAAYFGSWFPFPDNSTVDLDVIRRPTYLYLSHLHKDHFDAAFLAGHVDKSTVVLLPEFPLDEMRRALEGLGFSRFVQTTDGEPVDLDGVRVAICTATTPADGPLGDSTIAVDDGQAVVLDQNDCRPPDIDLLGALGPYDLHLLQYSGAIWYPMAYRMDPEEADRAGRAKRANQMARALRYVREVGAARVVPFAGPPAFLDDELFGLNDLGNDPANIFVDQVQFIEYLAERGVANAHLMIPGSVARIGPGRFEVRQPVGDDAVAAIFADKKAYLEAYRERRRPELDALSAPVAGPIAPVAGAGSGPGGHTDLVGELAAWWEPLLAGADRVCAGLGGPILVDMGGATVVVDPRSRQVRAWAGERWEHRFAVEEALVRSLVSRHVEDWVNELFLSCRFEADRRGGYNPTVFGFFKCLSPERMAYLEASMAPPGRRAATRRLTDAERAPEGETWRCGDWLVQRRCPHLGGDLARFGEVAGGVLTCTLHGWRFDLATGRCLTAEGVWLRRAPVPAGGAGGGGSSLWPT